MSIKKESKINFFYTDLKISIKNKGSLKKFIIKIFKHEKKTLKFLNYVFCNDKYLLEINKQFLLHDYYTDIITFDLSEKKRGIEGEIYISIERVKDNSIQMGVSFTNELCRVMFHGALHLCGYKDTTMVEKIKMKKMENKYLSKYKG